MAEQKDRVFHASEAADIEVFRPKRYWHIGFEHSGPLCEEMEPPEGADVTECFYASSASYVPFYYAPKSCPRLLVSRVKNSRLFDRLAKRVQPLQSDRIMFFRRADRKRLQSHQFTVYELPAECFERLPNGEFVAHGPVRPISRQSMTDVLASLQACGYQVVFVTDLETTRSRLLSLGLMVDSEGVRIAS